MVRYLTTGLAALLVLSGCAREDTRSQPPPPPAAMIAPLREHMTLDEKLAILETELRAALEGRLETPVSRGHMLRAEATTDRLLEADLPFEWLVNGYLLESRLRQIQALADRIVAKMRRNVDRNRTLAEAADLHRMVRDLRADLRQGFGGPAPPPLDSLLASIRRDTARR